MDNKTKAKPVKDFFIALLALIVFYLLYGILYTVAAFLCAFLSDLPLFNLFANFLVSKSGGDLVEIACCMSLLFSAIITGKMIEKLTEKGAAEDEKISSRIFAGILIAINLLFLIGNLIGHGAIFINIMMIIVGIIFIKAY